MTHLDQRVALLSLRQAATFLRYASGDVEIATAHLNGARADRAHELRRIISDALAYAHRIGVCVEGDLRADLA